MQSRTIRACPIRYALGCIAPAQVSYSVRLGPRRSDQVSGWVAAQTRAPGWHRRPDLRFRIMAASDWVPLWLQAAVAVGTLGLAAGTVYLATKAGNEASATQALAKEARTDRQLQWRPQLGLMDCWASMDGNGRFHFSIANVVGGPAVGCKAMARVPWDVNSWSLWIVGDVESGAQAAYTQDARRGLSVYSAFAAPDAMAEPRREPDVVLICSDILGRRYRFPIVDVFPREASNSSNPREMWKPFPPDIYEEGTPDAPPGAAIPCFGATEPRSPGLPSAHEPHAPARRPVPRLHRPARPVLADDLRPAAASRPLPRGALLDRQMVQPLRRPLVARVGLSQPPRGIDGAAGVWQANYCPRLARLGVSQSTAHMGHPKGDAGCG